MKMKLKLVSIFILVAALFVLIVALVFMVTAKPPQRKEPMAQIVRFLCPPKAPIAVIINDNAVVDDVSSDLSMCAISTNGRVVNNVTIEGIHYDWCYTDNNGTNCSTTINSN